MLHEPWQVILALLITSLAGILGGIAAILAARRGKRVHDRLTEREAMEAERLLEEKKWREQNIGVANGHGTLMAQMTHALERVGELAEHTYELKDGQSKIMSEVAGVKTDLTHHVNESAVYRASVHKELGAVRNDLLSHVEWEMKQKYPQEWDGTERRKSPPPHNPPAGKQERRRSQT